MSRYNIEITEPAERDLFEIANYIGKELLEPSIAAKVVNKIAESVFQLEEMPLRNALVTDERFAQLGFRKVVVDNFIVFYIVSEKRKIVTIIRILYGKRDWINLL